jgi:hypothetical protein
VRRCALSQTKRAVFRSESGKGVIKVVGFDSVNLCYNPLNFYLCGKRSEEQRWVIIVCGSF